MLLSTMNPISLKQQRGYKAKIDKLLDDHVATHGQLFPILVTKDLVIVSGSRLRDSCFRVGMVSVQVVVLGITYDEYVQKGSWVL